MNLMRIFSLLLFFLCMAVQAQEKIIYQVDNYGRTLNNKPSFSVQKDGRVIQRGTYGERQAQKQQYKIVDGKVYHADSRGNLQRHLPHYTLRDDGRLIEMSPTGQRRSQNQQYQIKDGGIYRVDMYGRKQSN